MNFETPLEVVQTLQATTNSAILKYPHTVAISDSRDVIIHVDFEKLGAEQFDDIPLLDSLSSFTSFLKLFSNDREVVIEDGLVTVKEGALKSEFITDNIALMDEFNKDHSQFEKTASVPTISKFSLTKENIKQLRDASGVFKDLEEILIVGKDSNTDLKLGNKSKFNAKSNTFSVTYPETATKEFDVAIPVTSFKQIPLDNYTFEVKYNSERDAYRILLTSDSVGQGLEIIMSVIS